jgi:hypothetical protein
MRWSVTGGHDILLTNPRWPLATDTNNEEQKLGRKSPQVSANQQSNEET